jgi:hypothetical protein
MPQYVEVQGNIIEFPDGMPPAEIESAIKANLMSIKPAASVQAGKEINSIPRQIGLTARYGLEGLANAAQMLTEPIRNALQRETRGLMDLGDRVNAKQGIAPAGVTPPQMQPLGQAVSGMLDQAGLPSPQGANERIVGDAARLMAGAGGMGGLAGAASAAPGLAGQAGRFLSANMGQQLGAAAGAGLAGGASREAGGSPLMQAGASLLGGVAGGAGVRGAESLAQGAANLGRRLIPGQQQLVQQRLDQRINIVLQEQGIDPATITPAMRAALREQVGQAMRTSDDLNPEAVARLADYTRLNMTPTRARLTLDPFDVTQEANASKLAAATGSRDARLPQIAQENNQRLIGLMDEMGGARPVDTFGQGSAVRGAIQAQDDALSANVNRLYERAREMAGGDIPIDRKPFVDNIFSELARSGKLSFAPENIMGRINQISGGVVRANGQDFDVPFTPQTIDELKTMVATAQRATNDGNVSAALSAIRRALDATPVNPVKNTFGGNQVVTGSGADFLRTRDAQPAAFMDALNQARSAAAQRFNWRETAGPIDAAIGGAIPDTFIKNSIISKAAGYEGVAQAAATINANPAAREAVRTSIVQHLKDASIGKGGTSQTGNFSGRGMEAALKDIGDRKLALFFEPAEVETLKAMARTGSFEVFQPRGSAVNNSNTAAGAAAILSGIADRVRPIANKIPLGETLVSSPLDNLAVWAMQRPAGNIPGGLLMPQQRQPMGQGLLLPGAAYGGLLAPTLSE